MSSVDPSVAVDEDTIVGASRGTGETWGEANDTMVGVTCVASVVGAGEGEGCVI